jgi:hypothetical protein
MKTSALITIKNTNGAFLKIEEATYKETRSLVKDYYTSTRGNDGIVVVSATQPGWAKELQITLVAKVQHTFALDAYKLATYVGPIVGMLVGIRDLEIPDIRSDRDFVQRGKRLEEVKVVLNSVRPVVHSLHDKSVLWNSKSPLPELDDARDALEDAYTELITELSVGR